MKRFVAYSTGVPISFKSGHQVGKVSGTIFLTTGQ